MKPHEPVAGCIHGSAVDSAQCGLTKREWLIGKALAGAMAAGATPADAGKEAILAADTAIAILKAEKDAQPVIPVTQQPAPLLPSQM